MVMYESKLDYNFSYIPETSLTMTSKEMWMEISLIKTTPGKFFRSVAIPHYVSVFVSFAIILAVFNLIFDVNKNTCNHALLGYAVLFVVAFKLRIMTMVSMSPLSD